MRPEHRIAHRIATAAIAAVVALPFIAAQPARAQDAAEDSGWRRAERSTRHVLVRTDNGVGCTEVDAPALPRHEPLHVIKGARSEKLAGAGLTIVLRATNQLENFPDAKNAFLRAAGIWESRIGSAITIIVDVDFGTKNFGQAYEPRVIGSTDSQSLIGDGLYGSTRSALITRASNAGEATLLASLPTGTIPTDIGSISTMIMASPNLRALGLISATANPSSETNFGDPPAIGFNSKFQYDFDPSNGIDFDKTDFEAVAVHELGHVLGFGSNVGSKELDSSNDEAFTSLDIFRFRPGVGSFTTSTRILKSGGSQIFFGGSSELALSTGRPDGSGGDGEQASHWKDDAQTGTFIGIMDPTIGDGQREQLTSNDMQAFNVIGYRLASELPVKIDTAEASLTGDTITITGHGSSTAGAITGADVEIVDANGTVLQEVPRFAVSLGTSGSFTLEIDGLSQLPTAVAADLSLVDAGGNQSASNLLDFTGADTNAPAISKFKLKNGKLVLTGTRFNISMQIEVNGTTVPLPAGSTVNITGKKAKVSLIGLTVRQGPNRFRLVLNGLRSNIIVVPL